LTWLSVVVFGLIMGSAVTALAYRVPRGVSWVRGRSACPSCGHALSARDLVPVLSWLSTRGRCRHCGAHIAWRYPVTELACVAWSVLLFARVGLTPTYPLIAIWGFLLIALFWIDLDVQLLPDVLTLPGTLIGVAAAVQWPEGARHAMFGILIASGLLWVLAEGYWRLRKVEGMGGGDIKLAAMFGVVLGWKLSLLTLFIAALAGSIWGVSLMIRRVGNRQTPIPFGTLLAPAAMATFLWGDSWVRAYLGLFRS
jgi:leader peptidase (prepilin peptidase)/N-methyltransferase